MNVYYIMTGVSLAFMGAFILMMVADLYKARREYATLAEAAANLGDKKRELLAVVRKELFRLLGVDRLVKRAFIEGWQMRREVNPGCFSNTEIDAFYDKFGCWRSVDEAWVNSDVEELV